MKRLQYIAPATVVILIWSVTASANGGSILRTETFGDSTYYLVGADSSGASINWTDSEAFANTLGGHLVTINNQAENDFVFDAFGDSDFRLWIGLSDQAVEGSFVWSSGDPVTYTNWGPGEPNDANAGEDYVYLRSPTSFAPRTWNDDPGVVGYGIVEVPEPTTLFLATLGLFGCITLRRRRRRR